MKIDKVLEYHRALAELYLQRIEDQKQQIAEKDAEIAIYRNFSEANGYREDQAWFWTDEWQAAEKEVDKEVDHD